MQQKLFDDTEQLILPEVLLNYTRGFVIREETTNCLIFYCKRFPGNSIKNAGAWFPAFNERSIAEGLEHRIAKSPIPMKSRINLTFRKVTV